MRTLLIIIGGVVLWAACLGAAKWLSDQGTGAMTRATVLFLVLWLIVAALNLWIGVTRAGYSVRDELPIFLLIFLVPAMLALFVRWKLL